MAAENTLPKNGGTPGLETPRITETANPRSETALEVAPIYISP